MANLTDFDEKDYLFVGYTIVGLANILSTSILASISKGIVYRNYSHQGSQALLKLLELC